MALKKLLPLTFFLSFSISVLALEPTSEHTFELGKGEIPSSVTLDGYILLNLDGMIR